MLFSFYWPGRDAREHKKMLIEVLSKTEEWLIENRGYGDYRLVHDSGLEISLDNTWKSVAITPAKVDIGEYGMRTIYFAAQELAARLMNKGIKEEDMEEVSLKKK